MAQAEDEEAPSPSRSALMARVRSKNTKPELVVRRIAHALGYRFRLHRKDLPGTPDLVFPRRKKVVLVHGCFWHRHPGCRLSSHPKTRTAFWTSRFDANVLRDAAALDALSKLGWQSLVVWECETRDADLLSKRLAAFLEGYGPDA